MRQPSINWLERKILCVWINFIHGQQQCSGFLSRRSEIREAFKNVTEMWSAVLMGLEGGSECRCKLQAKVWTFLLERKALRALAASDQRNLPINYLQLDICRHRATADMNGERERERQLRAIKLPQVRSKFQPNTLRLCCSYFILHPLQKLHSVHTLSSLVCIFLC